jgi:hypothetical protein
MTERKLYGATFGPYLYDDDATISDPDGDFANFVEHASISDGGHILAFIEFLDTDHSHGLKVYWNEDDTGHRELDLKVVGGNRTLTFNESFTIGDGFAGTLTYTADAKTLSVEDDSIVSQDYTADASPTFATVKLTNLSDGKIPKHTSDAVGLEDSILAISGSVLVITGTVACSDLTNGCVPYHVSDANGLADSLISIVGGATYVNGSLNVQTGGNTVIQLAPTSAWILVGREDTVAGLVHVYGHATGSAVGGKLRLDAAADHDTTITGYYVQAYEDDLYLGPSNDIDAVKLTNAGDLFITGGTISCSDLTDGYIPYHVSDAVGLANSPIFISGTDIGISDKMYFTADADTYMIRSSTNRFSFYGAGILVSWLKCCYWK